MLGNFPFHQLKSLVQGRGEAGGVTKPGPKENYKRKTREDKEGGDGDPMMMKDTFVAHRYALLLFFSYIFLSLDVHLKDAVSFPHPYNIFNEFPSLCLFYFSALSTLWESSPHNPLLIAQRHVTRAESRGIWLSYPGAWPFDR